jgi:hypothetical protein
VQSQATSARATFFELWELPNEIAPSLAIFMSVSVRDGAKLWLWTLYAANLAACLGEPSKIANLASVQNKSPLWEQYLWPIKLETLIDCLSLSYLSVPRTNPNRSRFPSKPTGDFSRSYGAQERCLRKDACTVDQQVDYRNLPVSGWSQYSPLLDWVKLSAVPMALLSLKNIDFLCQFN